mgnify:FL=1
MNGGLSMVEMKRKYKKSEYGLIPIDWKEGTFADFLEGFSAGATPYRGITSNFKGKIKWISSGELNYNRINDTIEHISEEAFTKTSLKIHPEGTFLMAITGLEAAGTRGRCAFVGNPAATNQSCMAIYPTDKMINEYLYYFYRKYSEILANKYCQGTKQKSYTSNIVKLLPIVCPPSIKEQASIATALSDVDSLISALTKKIEKKKAIKQGLMQQLLTGKKRLPGFGEKWVEIELGQHSIMNSGGTPSTANPEYYGGKIPFLSINDITNAGKFIYETEKTITEEGLKNSSARLFKKGTIMYAMYASVGKCAITKIRISCSQAILGINVDSTLDADFLYYYLVSIQDDVLNYGQTGTQTNLSKQIISSFILNVPSSKAEQTAIANILSDCDSEIVALEEKRDKYKEIKQGMMQQLLTGKIRLI